MVPLNKMPGSASKTTALLADIQGITVPSLHNFFYFHFTWAAASLKLARILDWEMLHYQKKKLMNSSQVKNLEIWATRSNEVKMKRRLTGMRPSLKWAKLFFSSVSRTFCGTTMNLGRLKKKKKKVQKCYCQSYALQVEQNTPKNKLKSRKMYFKFKQSKKGD